MTQTSSNSKTKSNSALKQLLNGKCHYSATDLYLQLCVHLQAEAPPICPYPSLRIGSPRRVLLSHNHSIYISPHKTGSPISPRDKIFYYVSSSPSNVKELNIILKTFPLQIHQNVVLKLSLYLTAAARD